MIALSVGLILLTVVTRLAMDTRQSGNSIAERGDELEQGRYAIALLKNDLRLAGFYGMLYQVPSVPSNLPDPCNSALSSLIEGLSLAVQGYDKPTTAANCTNGAMAGIDRLVIRRAGTEGFILDAGADDDDGDGDKDDLDYGRAYFQGFNDRYTIGFCSRMGQCSGATNCANDGCLDKLPVNMTRAVTGNEMTVFSMKYRNATLPVEVRPYEVHIYYLRPWSNDLKDGIPTLIKSELVDYGSAPKLIASPLIDGVENMAFQYGIDSTQPPDGIPDYYTTKPVNTQEWARVKAIRINLLIRSLSKIKQSTIEQRFDMGEEPAVILQSDDLQYRHHLLTTLVSLDNTLSRVHE